MGNRDIVRDDFSRERTEVEIPCQSFIDFTPRADILRDCRYSHEATIPDGSSSTPIWSSCPFNEKHFEFSHCSSYSPPTKYQQHQGSRLGNERDDLITEWCTGHDNSDLADHKDVNEQTGPLLLSRAGKEIVGCVFLGGSDWSMVVNSFLGPGKGSVPYRISQVTLGCL